jgi:hypothetical protein
MSGEPEPDSSAFNEEAFTETLKEVLQEKLKSAGGRRKLRGGVTATEAEEILKQLNGDAELTRIKAAQLVATNEDELIRLGREFDARQRQLLVEKGLSASADAIMAAAAAVKEAAGKLKAAGSTGVTGISAFADALGSALTTAYNTCRETVTTAAVAAIAFNVGRTYEREGSVQEVANAYITWLRTVSPLDAAMIAAGATLVIQRAVDAAITSCKRQRPAAPQAAPAALGDAAARPSGVAARRNSSSRFSDAPVAAAAAAADAAAPERALTLAQQSAVERARRAASGAPRGGRRTKRRRHHRHRPSAPTRKRRSSSGRTRGGSR